MTLPIAYSRPGAVKARARAARAAALRALLRRLLHERRERQPRRRGTVPALGPGRQRAHAPS